MLEQLEAGWTVDTITERCRVLSGSLRARGVTGPELEAMAPSGARNATTDPLGAAVVWYALLRARFEQEEARRADESRRAEAALSAAMVAEAVPVTLSVADAPTAVYPKSYHALAYCDALDAALQEVLALAASTDSAEVRTLGPLTQSLAVRLWAWILTHPEPGVPFDEGRPPHPPDWTTALTPDDLLELLRAHLEANRVRTARIAELFPKERPFDSRLTLAGFLGSVAQELGHRPVDVLRRWSQGEVFAQAAAAAQAAREGRAAAEAEAKDRRAAS